MLLAFLILFKAILLFVRRKFQQAKCNLLKIYRSRRKRLIILRELLH